MLTDGGAIPKMRIYDLHGIQSDLKLDLSDKTTYK